MLDKLTELGLSKGEIAVYSALLDLGETTKTALAKQSGVSPSNIYDITNRLLEKGLISRVEKNNIAHFSAANPKRLTEYLEKKKQEVEKEEEILESILPQLIAKYSSTQEAQKVEMFVGWNGLRTVLNDLLDECESGDHNYVFGASAGKNETQTDIEFLRFSRAREEKGIQTQIVFNEEVKERKDRIAFFLKSKNHDVRFLKQSTPTEILLYKNKTCIIIHSQKPMIIRITSDDATKSFKQYFDVIWAQAN